jgi:hypothetical protein
MRCLAALAAALAVVPTSLQHPFPPTCTGASVPGTPEYAGDYLHRIISVKGGKYGVGGLYYASEDGKLTNETTFERFDQSWRMTWTGCAYQLSRAFVDVDSTCLDDNTAASLLFVVDDNDAMCSHASAIGYCAISYFKAVCPKSCDVKEELCHGDDNKAIADLSLAMELDGAPLTCGQMDCDLASVKAVCKETCKHPDYLHVKHMETTPALNDYEAHYAERRLLTLGAAFGRDPHLETRMLQSKVGDRDTITYDPVYVYHSKTSLSASLDAYFTNVTFENDTYSMFAFDCDGETLEDDTPELVCDPTTVMRPVKDAELEWSCDKSEGFKTESYTFCPWVNVDVQPACENDDDHVFWYYYTCADWASDMTGSGVNDCYKEDDHFWLGPVEDGFYSQEMLDFIREKCPAVCGVCHPELSEESCYNNPTRPGFDDDGPDSNAICAPRETCEELCLGIDDCIGIDMVIGKHRCFLNRDHADMCSKDEVYTGEGGLVPPVGWYHPAGFGLNVGMRYPDGHIPARMRRLAAAAPRKPGELLWQSDSHHHLRRIKDQDMVWITTSDIYCRGTNINISTVNSTILCSKRCAGYPAEECADLALEASDTKDFAVCGYEREECEALCASLEDCIGFDMHKTKKRCWLNNYKTTCGATNTLDADDHDLVTKEYSDACEVELTGAGEGDGTYVQQTNTKFALPTKYEMVYEHCMWTIRDVESKERLYMISDKNESYCGDLEYKKEEGMRLKTWVGWNKGTLLHHATCEDSKIEVSFHCQEDEPCSTFQYCLLSTERMSYEMGKFRGDTDFTKPLCDVYNGSVTSEAIYDYKPKTIADKDRAEAVIDTKYHHLSDEMTVSDAGGHFLMLEIFRDMALDFRIRLLYLGEAFSKGVVTLVNPVAALQELGSVLNPPDRYTDFVTDFIRFELYNETGGPQTDAESVIEFDAWSSNKDADKQEWFYLAYDKDGVSFWEKMGPALTQEPLTEHQVLDVMRRRLEGHGCHDDESQEHCKNPCQVCEMVGVCGSECPEGDHRCDGDCTPTHRSLETTHESHWMRVRVEPAKLKHDFGCALVIAAALDIDDCATNMDKCEENAMCQNKPAGYKEEPGYTCVCKKGFKKTKDGQCMATSWTAESMVVRVENDEEFTKGWRVQEVELYADEKCEGPQILEQNHWSYGRDAPGWYWAMIEDTYCLGNNFVPVGYEGSKCSRKCSARTSSGPCSGYLKSDTNSPAICEDRATCLEICAETADCVGVDMHEFENRCYLNSASKGSGDTCEAQLLDMSLRMEDVHYEMWVKQDVLKVSASSSFEEHPAYLVNDQSKHSEWWSGSFRKPRMGEYIDFDVTSFAPVKAVKVHQRAEKSLSAYRVHLGFKWAQDKYDKEDAKKPVRTSVLDVPGKHVQHAETGGTIEDRSRFTKTVLVSGVQEYEAPCVAITCGSPSLFWSPKTLLGSYETPSPCHCKQLCLDHVDEGCRSWMWYNEKDTNYWTDEAFHHHRTCNLHSSRLDTQKTKPSVFAVSGDVDLVLLELEPKTAPVGTFDLTVKGAGFPAQTTKQRIKIVEESCDEEPVAEAVGISCSSPYVCHPQPKSADGESATWSVELLGSTAEKAYKVCYCAGVCYSAGQWTLVPGDITVPAASLTFTLDNDGASTLDTADANQKFKLKFPEKVHNLTLIPAFEHECSEAAVNAADTTLFAYTEKDGDGMFPTGGVKEVEVTIDQATYGNYTVCVGRQPQFGVLTFFPVPQSTGTPYLTLAPTESDAAKTAGIFRNAGSWSVKTGTTVDIALAGAELDFDDFAAARVAFAAPGSKCGEGTYTEPAQYALEPNQAKSSETSLVFPMDVPEDATPGKFFVCFCVDGTTGNEHPKFKLNETQAPVPRTPCGYTETAGEIVITRRVDTGKNYVLDPASSELGEGSIEITGTDLDWRKDRIMIVNCQDTCGRAEATEYASMPKAWGSAKPVNTKDYSGEITVEEPYTVDGLYTEIKDRYCRGNNIGEGTELITRNLCYNKCEDGCTGDACFCGGYYQGFDTAESTALCLPQSECEHLCTLMGDACWGVDMHKDSTRCFLNGPACQDQVQALSAADGLGYDTSYLLLQKKTGAPMRKLQAGMAHINWAASARGELVMMPGVSTTYNLRFTDITFNSSGTFKVCFCDWESADGDCDEPSDFLIEVGQVHVSGVHCLLTVPKLRATKCYEQYYGGLSCADELPEIPAGAPKYPTSYGTYPSP